MKTMFSATALVILTVAITGCATTTGLTQAQCQQGDWKQIGYQDGLMGRSPVFINQHTQRCQASHVLPNQSEWEAGRKEGLQKYCTPLRAYQLGREGYRFNNELCSPEQTVELLKANDEGLYNYDRQQSVQAGFGWGYAGYDPFWGTRWNGGYGWGGYAVPVYVPVVERGHFEPVYREGHGKFFHR